MRKVDEGQYFEKPESRWTKGVSCHLSTTPATHRTNRSQDKQAASRRSNPRKPSLLSWRCIAQKGTPRVSTLPGKKHRSSMHLRNEFTVFKHEKTPSATLATHRAGCIETVKPQKTQPPELEMHRPERYPTSLYAPWKKTQKFDAFAKRVYSF